MAFVLQVAKSVRPCKKLKVQAQLPLCHERRAPPSMRTAKACSRSALFDVDNAALHRDHQRLGAGIDLQFG